MTHASNSDATGETLQLGRQAKRFVQTPEWVVLSDVSPQAKALYSVLLGHVNRKRKDRLAWPGMETLADMLGFKQRKSVQRYLAELIELGAVDVKRQRATRRNNIYTINETPPPGYAGTLTFAAYYAARGTPEPAGHAPANAADPEVPMGTDVPLAASTAVPTNKTKSTRRKEDHVGAATRGRERAPKQLDSSPSNPAAETEGRKRADTGQQVMFFPPRDFHERSAAGARSWLRAASVSACARIGRDLGANAAGVVGRHLLEFDDGTLTNQDLLDFTLNLLTRAVEGDPELRHLFDDHSGMSQDERDVVALRKMHADLDCYPDGEAIVNRLWDGQVATVDEIYGAVFEHACAA